MPQLGANEKRSKHLLIILALLCYPSSHNGGDRGERGTEGNRGKQRGTEGITQGRRWEKISGGADPFRGGAEPPKISNFGQIIKVPLVNFFGTQDFGEGAGAPSASPSPTQT